MIYICSKSNKNIIYTSILMGDIKKSIMYAPKQHNLLFIGTASNDAEGIIDKKKLEVEMIY